MTAHRPRSVTACVAALLLAVAPIAGAGNHADKGQNAHGKGKDKGDHSAVEHGQGVSTEEALIQGGVQILTAALFTERERRVIRESFRDGYPSGFEPPKPIPPGIRKKLARGGTLPPGIAKTRLPPSVQERLPHREGEVIVVIDRDAYLIRRGTELILDVLENVLR